ncbi:type II toxin-antitoxin system RelE/ParE family toxin [Candidatus Sumerlaeota bacterium]|nr:type II toxin-antitoxin system RelE/ParE family toxin [Candidatus Sumerlaeota bacterium]
MTVLHEAETELWEAVAYYESRGSGLEPDLLAEVETSIETVARYPERWPLRPDGTRRYVTHRFPYLVVHLYEDRQVWVIAIAHSKRKPGHWTHRKTATARRRHGQ